MLKNFKNEIPNRIPFKVKSPFRKSSLRCRHSACQPSIQKSWSEKKMIVAQMGVVFITHCIPCMGEIGTIPTRNGSFLSTSDLDDLKYQCCHPHPSLPAYCFWEATSDVSGEAGHAILFLPQPGRQPSSPPILTSDQPLDPMLRRLRYQG